MQNKSKIIAQFIIDNPTLTQSEISKHFNVSRQRIEQIYKNELTEEQKNSRVNTKNQQDIDLILPLVKDNTPKAVISALTGISANRINKLYTIEPIKEIVEKFKKEKNEMIENVSKDWFEGMTIANINVKYDWNLPLSVASTHISNLRKKYPDKFPIRLHNQTSLQSQIESYLIYKNEGKSDVDIAAILGYKNVASMKSAFNSLNKNHEHPKT